MPDRALSGQLLELLEGFLHTAVEQVVRGLPADLTVLGVRESKFWVMKQHDVWCRAQPGCGDGQLLAQPVGVNTVLPRRPTGVTGDGHGLWRVISGGDVADLRDDYDLIAAHSAARERICKRIPDETLRRTVGVRRASVDDVHDTLL